LFLVPRLCLGTKLEGSAFFQESGRIPLDVPRGIMRQKPSVGGSQVEPGNQENEPADNSINT
jgi:hypothetical protein